ncbi:MAG: lipopolysaccharide heptosyltransferase family protein [Caulobacteraceae bacterium]|jgi:hypothetical protein|nr:lipopolysaccharide heptosyltransferase family protein [Caulobacteraceae bacterium]
MHLIERYATSCGVKIGKPFIYEKFFPLPIEKYICFQPFSKYNSKNYDYWQEVLEILIPYLEEYNIKIVQIGTKNDKQFLNTAFLGGQTTINQAAYIIKNSILHLGADSFGVHIASGYDKKIVALYSNSNIENACPYWTKKQDKILISSNRDKKPSYSAEENPKSINNIKPEEIAYSVLKLLNIKFNNNKETINFGSDYNLQSYEIIPEDNINLTNFLVENPIVRMDYCFNEIVLEQLLQQKKCIIFTNKPIKKEIIEKYKSNINQIIYIIEEENSPNFVKLLKINSINYILLSFLAEEVLNKFKLDYLDYNLIINKKHKTKEDFNIKNINNLHYKSSRTLYGAEGKFISRYDWINKNGDKVVDDPEFWKEADNFYIFKLT